MEKPFTELKMSLKTLLLYTPMFSARFTLVLASFFSGIFLIFSSDRLGSSAVLSVLHYTFDERLLGCLFLLHAFSALSSLLRQSITKALKIADGALGMMLWSFTTISFFVSYTMNTDITMPPVYLASSISCLFTALLHFAQQCADYSAFSVVSPTFTPEKIQCIINDCNASLEASRKLKTRAVYRETNDDFIVVG